MKIIFINLGTYYRKKNVDLTENLQYIMQYITKFPYNFGIFFSSADLNEVIVGHTSYQYQAEYDDVSEEHRNVIRSQDIN